MWKTPWVIHSLNNTGDNYSPVIIPNVVSVWMGPVACGYFHRVVIRKPTKAIAKPIRMFHEPSPGIG